MSDIETKDLKADTVITDYKDKVESLAEKFANDHDIYIDDIRKTIQAKIRKKKVEAIKEGINFDSFIQRVDTYIGTAIDVAEQVKKINKKHKILERTRIVIRFLKKVF